jgi:hypothetical protein
MAAPLNPSANIPLAGVPPAACNQAPAGATCEQAVMRGLDAARAKLGLGPYLLPRGFLKMLPARQWLVLSNLDRRSYGLRPILGLAKGLDAVAHRGAAANADPNPDAYLHSVNAPALGFASNWAGGQQNALIAYYGWMYDDGYGGPNLDCRTPSDQGCWGHREDILSFRGVRNVVMGAASARGRRSWALTVVATDASFFHLSYSWAQAVADGAGGTPN